MDALTRARQVLAARVIDPKVKFVPGLADDLRAILGGFTELQRRVEILAACALRVSYGAAQPRSHVQALADMGEEAAAIKRALEHGGQCCCVDCMRDRHG